MSAGACPRCGAPLAAGQEWCLECGAAARTRIARAPGPGLALAIVAAVVLVVAITSAAAIEALREDSNEQARRPVATTTAPATTTGREERDDQGEREVPGSKEAKAPALAAWPRGKRAWTVILFSTSDRAGALAAAKRFAGAGDVGVLRTSDFANLRPGLHAVFAGVYPSQARAAAAADKARAAGAADAYPRLVDPR